MRTIQRISAFFAFLLLSTASLAETIIDTGELPAPWRFTTLRSDVDNVFVGIRRAAQFTISRDYRIDTVQSFAGGTLAGQLTLAVYADAGGLPGREIHSTPFPVLLGGPFWQGSSSLNWPLSAGTYWVSVELRPGQVGGLVVALDAGAPSLPPPRPQPRYANFFPSIGYWTGTPSAKGWRISGSRVGDGKTVGEKAIEIAQAATNAPYRLGFKGWDTQARTNGGQRYVQSSELFAPGYFGSFFNPSEMRPGIDCSGFVLWSFNQAFGERRYPAGAASGINYEGADGQYWNSTDRFTNDADLRPGDLIFLDYELTRPANAPFGSRGTIDHVAIYVGNGQAIEAGGGNATGSVRSVSLASLKALRREADANGVRQCCAFVGYGRVRGSDVAFAAITQSPVTLAVTDPDGYAIDSNTLIRTREEALREVPGELYYSVADGGHDAVYSPTLKQGAYAIRVAPKPDALPDDVFSLRVELSGGRSVVLADRARVSEIPANGYGVLVGESISLGSFIPIELQIKRPALTRIAQNAAGRVSFHVLSTRTFDATTIDASSVRFGPAGAQLENGQLRFEDIDCDGLLDVVMAFRISDIGYTPEATKLDLWAATSSGTAVHGVRRIGPAVATTKASAADASSPP